MKNTLELQFCALRPPRVLKKTNAGDPDLIDVWAMHRGDRTLRQWAIAVKFGREVAAQATAIKTGTLFTVKGRLEQTRNPATGIYHTVVWAQEIVDLIHPKKSRIESPAASSDPGAEMPELDLPEVGQDEENPQT